MINTHSLHDYISPTSEIIEEARAGRMFILVDDEDRENEGDLVIPAQFATTEAINFMARHARGLICLAMTRGRVDQLGLSLMSAHNRSRHSSAFTVSIEARHGISTGISAADRARTVAVAINSENPRDEIATPGHIFPLAARDGGSLVRAGHTEAAVDIARLAGLNPSGVICEVMNEDGTMGRLPELVAFAQRYNLKLGTIADLIQHRRRTEKLVRRSFETWTGDLEGGDWAVKVFEDTLTGTEHLALVKGDLAAPGSSLVRSAGQRPARLGRLVPRHRASGPGCHRAAAGYAARCGRPQARAERGRPGGGPCAAPIRHRRANSHRSRRARHDPAHQPPAQPDRAGGLRPQHRRSAAV
jgi:3,4-dihydroxy 2-butanone 4-phosphate synthase/GTP cyclohydrolase II